MSTAYPDCSGFKAHSINPSRCRRCFKDISEHQNSGNTASIQDENGGNNNNSKIRRSHSLKASDTNSPSVSFTLKPKSVKYGSTDNDDNANSANDSSSNENGNDPKRSTTNEPMEVAFTVCVKKKNEITSATTAATSTTSNEHWKNEDYQSRIKELSNELSKSKEKINQLEYRNKELENMRKSFSKSETKDSIKQNFDENIKLKQRINDLEVENKLLKNDKKTLEDKLKKKPAGIGTGTEENSEVNELRNKLSQSEKIISQLTQENEDIKKDVKELEIEFQELHDNFREDQSSEFRVIKHELETMSKNCRILQFKLKKAERTIEQLENEKLEMKKQLNELYETAQLDVDKKRMKELENELSIAKEVSLKLHAEIETIKEERELEQNKDCNRFDDNNNNKTGNSNNSGNNNSNSNNSNHNRKHFAKLSPSTSLDQSNKDYEQVVRDLYDTMEREKDLQEQLKFSEEETRTTRKKLSTMEQENEILMLQIRKMTLKNNQQKDDDDENEDELNPEEMKLHLELYEQEMIVLRRKTDELEQENENFQQEIKYLQEKLVSQPITKVEIPEIPPGSPPNVIYDHKIKILETEARELRKKIVDKEKENESLRTEVELHRRRASKVINRSRSLDSEGQSLDMKKQLQLFEQEANILRHKLISLENENEKLLNENKRLQLRISKKPPPGPVDQLQMENVELQEKIRELERKCSTLKTDLMNTKLNETTETETEFIANLKKQLRTKETDLAKQASKLTKMDIEFAKINREYKKLKESLNPRRRISRVIRETATRLELKEIIKEMEDDAETLQTNIRGKDAIIENLSEELSELKRTMTELEQKQNDTIETGSININEPAVADWKRRLEEEQHRTKSLQEKLDKLNRTMANVKSNETDTIGAMKMEQKNYLNKIECLEQELCEKERKINEIQNKLNETIKNNEELNGLNDELNKQMENLQEKFDSMKLKINNNLANESFNDKQEEMERVRNFGKHWKMENSDLKSSSNTKECSELKQKLEESRSTINELKNQIEKQRNEFKEKEMKIRDELNQKMENNTKNVRKEIHLELQTLREESTNYKNRCNELTNKLDKAEKETKELNEKLKTTNAQVRKEQNEMQNKILELENQIKTEQRKRERLEKELDSAGRGKEEDLLRAQEKTVQLEREIRRYQAKIDDLEYNYNNKINSNEKELGKLRQEYDDLTNKYELLEKDYVDLKSRAVTEKDALVEAVSSLKTSYEDKLAEIKTLKDGSMRQRKEWYQEKLGYQERVANLESKLNKANLVEEERNRLKLVITEKENLLNSYRKEERSRNEDRERSRIKIDSLQNRVAELERVERNARFLSITGRAQVDKELQDYKIRLEHSETSHKGELAALHAEYEGRMRLLGEEVEHLQQQMSHLAQERDRYRESLEKKETKETQGTFKGSFKDEVEDLNSQLRIIRTDLEGALLENRNLKIQHGTEKSTWQIQLAEYRTQINQLEERILLETRGSTRNYARTKMELAWEKERQENQRLLQETQKFIQELRDKLMDNENLREKEREEARRQLLDLKTNMDREHVETQQKIAELQFDLLALKEIQAKLKTQNERFKRERSFFEKAKMDFMEQELTELQKLADNVKKNSNANLNIKTNFNRANNNNNNNILDAINQLQDQLQNRYNEAIQEARSSSQISTISNINGRYTGSNTSISSTNLPLPSVIKRAPPRLKLIKKSLSLDQQLRGSSQDRIWDSDHSLDSTPNSSVSNLRAGSSIRGFGYAGYESDSSGSSFIPSSAALVRLRPGFAKDSSFAGSDSDNSAISASAVPSKKSLKDKFKIKKSSKHAEVLEHHNNNKIIMQGFEKSPLELAKQREKKEKSLRYKISKTLSKTFSRSASVLSEISEQNTNANNTAASKSGRTKSPTRTKSPEPNKQQQQQQLEPRVIPGVAQLKQRPIQSNLAIPPSKRSPPKIHKFRTETNV